jgi:hypothetical protein
MIIFKCRKEIYFDDLNFTGIYIIAGYSWISA